MIELVISFVLFVFAVLFYARILEHVRSTEEADRTEPAPVEELQAVTRAVRAVAVASQPAKPSPAKRAVHEVAPPIAAGVTAQVGDRPRQVPRETQADPVIRWCSGSSDCESRC